jgi:hypothetical protein
MVDGLHIKNKMRKPLAIVLRGEREVEGERWWG